MAYLYKVSQHVRVGYDTYDSMIVCANSTHEAQQIHPHQGRPWPKSHEEAWEDNNFTRVWCERPEQTKVELIGLADPSIEPNTVLLASFNAG